ncbi:MAG: hypothetical protein ACUVWX_00030 [Kiritimatiellia bacterium]
MKRALVVAGSMLVLFGMIWTFTGCEWETSGENDTWDDSNGWVSFSGVYRTVSGGCLMQGTSATKRDTVGTGNGAQKSFAKVLTPIVLQGSVTVSDGYETFTDAAMGGGGGTNLVATGNLVGDKGGTGTINYLTGAMSVTFATEPGMGVRIWAVYLSSEAGQDCITTLSIQQLGNELYCTDDHGLTYRGTISTLRTPAGTQIPSLTVPIDLLNSPVLGDFEIISEDGTVRIVGTLNFSWTRAGGAGTGQITGISRTLNGVLIDQRTGQSGNVAGTAVP